MSRANPNNKNNPANRGVGGHIKEGLKNIPKVYDALYNAKGPNGASLGVKNTVKANARTIATGKSSAALSNKAPAGQRAKIATVGATSVTPLGPVVAMGMGIKKSIDDKAKAKAAIKAAAPKAAPKPLTPVQKAQANKAKDMKKTLNNAFPGLNMK